MSTLVKRIETIIADFSKYKVKMSPKLHLLVNKLSPKKRRQTERYFVQSAANRDTMNKKYIGFGVPTKYLE
ncbi:hypothetical protein AMS66_07665 [Paenibacillus xylanivorans]|uniref:Uncharacterized protein n=1 Tax=Paenibacillus xylanivorans TaxID=1705561 RepID=A0A0M9BRB6_9BACL|nr:hypothetical protein AMS66_07665 [Paenibacillus xylanivorans]